MANWTEHYTQVEDGEWMYSGYRLADSGNGHHLFMTVDEIEDDLHVYPTAHPDEVEEMRIFSEDFVEVTSEYFVSTGRVPAPYDPKFPETEASDEYGVMYYRWLNTLASRAHPIAELVEALREHGGIMSLAEEQPDHFGLWTSVWRAAHEVDNRTYWSSRMQEAAIAAIPPLTQQPSPVSGDTIIYQPTESFWAGQLVFELLVARYLTPRPLE